MGLLIFAHEAPMLWIKIIRINSTELSPAFSLDISVSAHLSMLVL
jgi:hypothetical protein